MRCFRIPVILSFYLSSFHFFWLLVPKLRKSNRGHREFAKHSVRWNGWILLLNKSVSYRFLLQSKLYYQFSSLQCFEFYPTNHLFYYITLFSKKKGIRPFFYALCLLAIYFHHFSSCLSPFSSFNNLIFRYP